MGDYEDMYKSLKDIRRHTYESIPEWTSTDVCIDDSIICTNCGAEYSESIRICEVCGVDMLCPIKPMPMEELVKKISEHIFEELL